MRLKVLAVAVVALLVMASSSDLLFAGASACGQHPCCAHGSCAMKQSSRHASFDRCHREESLKPLSFPDILPALQSQAARHRADPLQQLAGPAAAHDGYALSLERPPRR